MLLLSYAAQYETRHFNTSMNERKKNAEIGRVLTSYCTTSSELDDIKQFRFLILPVDKLLIRSELDHRALAICAHAHDLNLKSEQLKQIRSTSTIPTTLLFFIPFEIVYRHYFNHRFT